MLKLFIQILCAALLISCSSSGDIKKFIEDTKKANTSNISPLPRLKEYEQIIYTASKLRDPFNMPVRNVTLKLNTHVENLIIASKRPDADRKKEYLERMSLDSLTMVGTIKKKGETWALIVDKTGIVHKVREGNYVGENSGRIKKIHENNMDIDETIADEQGNWVNRKANLSINSNR